MRKTMLSLMLAAGVAVPAMAHAEGWAFQDRPDAPHQQGERPHDGGQGGGYHNGGGRPQQAPAPAPQPHPQMQPQPLPQVHVQANAQVGGHFDGQRGGWNRPDGYRPQGGPQGAAGSGGYRPQPGQPGYQDRLQFASGSGGYRPQPGQPGYRGGPQVAPGSGGYRPQSGQPGYGGGPPGAPGGGYRPQPPQPAFGGGYRPGSGGGSWNRTWRDDSHYDWHSYRVENRYIFNLPRYYAPPGWGYGYRRFAPGFTLSAVLYAQDYWINDPFYYRLPPAYGPYRWVRYYNDALLIDLRTGYVVDTVYDIFW